MPAAMKINDRKTARDKSAPRDVERDNASCFDAVHFNRITDKPNRQL